MTVVDDTFMLSVVSVNCTLPVTNLKKYYYYSFKSDGGRKIIPFQIEMNIDQERAKDKCKQPMCFLCILEHGLF